MKRSLPVDFRSHEIRDCSVSYVLILTDTNEIYNRYGYKVVFSLDKHFESEIDGQLHTGLRGYVLNRKVGHVYQGPGATLIISIVEPASSWGKRIGKLLGTSNFLRLEALLGDISIDSIFPAVPGFASEMLSPLVQNFFRQAFWQNVPAKPLAVDDRINFVIRFINDNLGETLELSRLADLVHLSPERLRHLFTEQMGISFSKYVLWQRVRRAMFAVDTEQIRFNQAVSQFGFTDHAHFNHVFKDIFGVSPKLFMQMARAIIWH